MNRLYKRYLLKTFLSRFLFLFFVLIFFYLLIDMSLTLKSKIQSFHVFNEIFFYYFFQVVQQLNILIPFCFVLSLIQTIFYFNFGFELIALQALGISKQKILKPFLVFSWILTFFLYLNTQIFLPYLEKKMNKIIQNPENSLHSVKEQDFFQLTLPDQSLVIYREYEPITNRFFDLYWIASNRDYWHIEQLNREDDFMVGDQVDHFQRTENEGMVLKEQKDRLILFNMPLFKHHQETKQNRLTFLSFTQLFLKQLQIHPSSLTYQQIQSKLWYQLTIPLLSPLLFFIFSISSIRYSRNRKQTFVIGFAALFLFAIVTLLNAFSILSEYRILPGYIASFGTFVVFFFPSLYFYFRKANS